jgi:predicted DNA-binding transcriptional regulator YafY
VQVNRLFEIIYILLDKKIVTAKELAEHFGVSQRTIYRDVDTLSLAGIPVYTEKGKGGGISLLPEFVLNKSILSEKEQNEILTALHGLANVKTAETDQVLQKLSTIFNKTAANWLEVDFSDWSYANGCVFNDFKTAILDTYLKRCKENFKEELLKHNSKKLTNAKKDTISATAFLQEHPF